MKPVFRLILVISIAVSAGCASLPAGNISDPRDPWERYNRVVFDFNDGVDRAVVKPLAQAYRDYVPELAQNGLRNFFSNLRDVIIAIHQLLQAKPEAAVTAGGRVLVNTTVGVLGLGDPASSMGLTKTNEDFGQTFGRWVLVRALTSCCLCWARARSEMRWALLLISALIRSVQSLSKARAERLPMV